MTELSNFQLEIDLNDPELGDSENQEQAQKLQKELQDMIGVETIVPSQEFYPSIGHRSVGGFLTGILMAEVNPANIARLFAFLSDRLGNKAIKVRIKAPDGRELEVEASSKEEIEYAIAQAERFIGQ